ncbi:hypothetical protein J6590_039195 [Homalodisca vitripennis]|nr:hypothetical protein J6590_039195 [Homalodisca vitripennis]
MEQLVLSVSGLSPMLLITPSPLPGYPLDGKSLVIHLPKIVILYNSCGKVYCLASSSLFCAQEVLLLGKPSYLRRILQTSAEIRDCRTRQDAMLDVPRVNAVLDRTERKTSHPFVIIMSVFHANTISFVVMYNR